MTDGQTYRKAGIVLDVHPPCHSETQPVYYVQQKEEGWLVLWEVYVGTVSAVNIIVDAFCTNCQHLHMDQKKALPLL